MGGLTGMVVWHKNPGRCNMAMVADGHKHSRVRIYPYQQLTVGRGCNACSVSPGVGVPSELNLETFCVGGVLRRRWGFQNQQFLPAQERSKLVFCPCYLNFGHCFQHSRLGSGLVSWRKK